MKRICFLITIIAMFCSANALAQDVILKNDGTEIKAKVVEIDDHQIKYKIYEYQDGPTRIINTYDVMTVSFENGTKELFNTQPSQSIVKTFDNPSYPDLENEFISIDTDDDMMLEFFKKYNYTEYYEDFASACKRRSTGKKLLGAGIGVSVASVALMVCGQLAQSEAVYYFGFGVSFVGEGLIIASIPISAAAGGKKKSIKNDFAKRELGLHSNIPELKFGTTANGVGLTLNF